MSEAQRTNKPSGKCHYWLMISKTCQEAKSIPARGPAKELPMFVNAEEEFFHEVQKNNIRQLICHIPQYGNIMYMCIISVVDLMAYCPSFTASCGEV